MNIWVTAESAWMDMIKWEKCQFIAPRHELKTYPMWAGVDLAHKIDICAAVKLWRADNGHAHADFKFWLPEGRLENVPLKWRRCIANGLSLGSWN